ncbi:VHS1123 protein [Vibrio phage 1]|nr:VHS1123 protein [Vibrio phage 1]
MASVHNLKSTRQYITNAWLSASKLNTTAGRQLAEELKKLIDAFDKDVHDAEIEAIKAVNRKAVERDKKRRGKHYPKFGDGSS